MSLSTINREKSIFVLMQVKLHSQVNPLQPLAFLFLQIHEYSTIHYACQGKKSCKQKLVIILYEN